MPDIVRQVLDHTGLEPDPHFESELEDRLLSALDAPQGDELVGEQFVPEHPDGSDALDRRLRRRVFFAVLASAAVLAVATVVTVLGRNDRVVTTPGTSPTPTAPTSPAPAVVTVPTTVPPTTTARPPTSVQPVTVPSTPTSLQPVTTLHGPTATAAPAVPPAVPGVDRASFSPSSVTFVSRTKVWALGGDCGQPQCTSVSLLTSNDRGQTWAPVNPPPARWDVAAAEQTGDPTLADTAFRVRFANDNDGYAFGGGLWSTHDGATTWQKVGVPNGVEVDALEVADGVAHAVISGNDGFRVMTSPADHDDWKLAPIVIPYGAGPVPSVQLVLNHTAGWILENDRTVVGGVRLLNGTWSTWTPPCMSGGGPATLAASSATDVWAVCNEGIWGGPNPPATRAYHSTDGGASFTVATGQLPSPTTDGVQALATPGPTTAVVGSASSSGLALRASFDTGASWSTVWSGQPVDQWSELGFTNTTQGVAVISKINGSGQMLLTDDGGHHWSSVSFAH